MTLSTLYISKAFASTADSSPQSTSSNFQEPVLSGLAPSEIRIASGTGFDVEDIFIYAAGRPQINFLDSTLFDDNISKLGAYYANPTENIGSQKDIIGALGNGSILFPEGTSADAISRAILTANPGYEAKEIRFDKSVGGGLAYIYFRRPSSGSGIVAASILSIRSSSSSINEGDSLSTSLSGLTPNSTLYFKVVGKGINQRDFSSGRVKGSIKVDANGMATISHALRADKATEGEESFSIQLFSDKKMRNLLGQSEPVTVFDTSMKATKKSRATKTPDIYNLSGTPKFGIEVADRITNFNAKAKDRLQIDVSEFGSNASATFKIAKNSKTLTKALASAADFIYLKSTGELYYNENGAAPGFGDGGIFAILENKANIALANVEFL